MATNIVDHVRVPDDLEPGQYLLSWRWDVEQVRWLCVSVCGGLSWHYSIYYFADMICGVILISCSHKLACSICNCRMLYLIDDIGNFCISILLIQSRRRTCVCIQYITQTHQIWQNCADVTIR